MKSALSCLVFGIPLLAACADVSYDKVGRGTFSGKLFVMWVDPGGSSGDGRFLYVPTKDDPLIFARPGQALKDGIRPTMMYTDGGSIPRAFQGLKGMSPWGFAPAYMVHDWLFVARHCLNDNDPSPEYAKVASLTFRDSAAIGAEAIKTVVADKDLADASIPASLITLAISSPFSLALWNRHGVCGAASVKQADRDAAERQIPGSAAFRAAKGLRLPPGAPRAEIVGVLSFR